LKEQDGKVWTGFVWLRIGQMIGSCEHSNELSGSITFWHSFDQLNEYYLLRKLNLINWFVG
jgi:hypothetical protein